MWVALGLPGSLEGVRSSQNLLPAMEPETWSSSNQGSCASAEISAESVKTQRKCNDWRGGV